MPATSKIFLFPFLFLLSIALAAQDSLVPDDYLDNLEDFMEASRNKKAQDAFQNFYGLFLSGTFTPEEQLVIVKTTDLMQAMRVAPQRGFVDYFHALEKVKSAENGETQFQEWHDVATYLLNETPFKVNRYSAFLATSDVYLHQNILDKPGGTDWVAAGGKPSWEYRGGEAHLKIDELERLVAISANDSLAILNTSIDIDLVNEKALGKGGKVSWERNGLSPDVYAELDAFSFATNRGQYTAKNARMFYPEYFEGRVLEGTFTDQIIAGGVKATTEYPRFTSTAGYVEIEDVGDGIDLRGNFEMRGATVYAIGDQGRQAEVELFIADKDGEKKVHGKADRFSVRQGDKVLGDGVETSIYFGEDSLYHPSVTMKVDVEGRVMQLIRTRSGTDRNPFYHSLNRVNIYADYIDVFLDQDSMVVGKPTVTFADKSPVVVESEDFFSPQEYFRIQNISSVNPLALMLSLREQVTGNDFISTDRVAQAINPDFRTDNIQSLLFDLAADGFINYDVENKRLQLKPKVSHYVRSNLSMKDFDRMKIESNTPEVNAFIDLTSGRINLVGVKPIEFSREKRTRINPLGEMVVVSGDRDFDFDGEINAGFSVMTGKEFGFKYHPYHIELDSVRYLDFFIPETPDNPENVNAKSIGSRLEHLEGYLLLDAPKNKSGRENIDIFPSLQSKGVSYIFYDQGDTAANYDRDSFFFQVDPFSFNHLNSLTDADMEFKGNLNSGGIFPEIEETASLQDDRSLGFITDTDTDGTDMYGERGHYSGQISLNNSGLRGIGKLDYLGAVVEAEDFKFRLDNTTASARQFNLEEDRGEKDHPQIRGQEVTIEWRPYADSLMINSSKETPFDMYQSGDHNFDGLLVLTPEGVKGTGKLSWSAATMSSEAIDFGAFRADADTANVQINSLESDDRLALKTENVNAKVNFDAQVGTFQNNGNELVTELPYNQFSTSIKKFDWDMAGNTISFRADEGKLGRFTSINEDQEELTFQGTEAIYDLSTSMLDVQGVDSVRSADATIYPPEGKIRVEPGAKITEITDARIVADTVNRYHVINRATVNILGRRKYKASGFYEYNVGPHEQELELQEIIGTPVGKGKYSEKATETRASGEIEEGTEFYVDDKIKFQGTINLETTNKNLFFDGFAKIEADYLYSPTWFRVRSEGDKRDLTLQIKSPQNQEGTPLHTGFYLSKDRQLVYPSMVEILDFRKDHPILPITGVLNYDEKNDRFLFGDSTRVVEGTTMGNIMTLDNRLGKLSGEGILGVGGRLTYVDTKNYGRISMDVPPKPVVIEEKIESDDVDDGGADDIMILDDEEPTDTTAGKTLTIDVDLAPEYPEVVVEMMSAIQFNMPKKLLNIMTTDIKAAAFASPALNLINDGEFYRDGVRNLFPESKEREAALQGMSLGYIDLPAKVNPHTFLFSKLKLKWQNDYQSFISDEKLTGLVSINGESVNKMLEIYVEYKMPSAGDDRIGIYLKSPSELFYFFYFKDGIMNVVSNNPTFMTELEGIKTKDLVFKMPDGEEYEIIPVELSSASTFLRRAKNAF
ncbi:hypothetical protein CEQ90_05720 [Lewinellaceae bacterium SD302]|nr:hypothetical protein CEQ90_05720 [Lewinellaceae bacterium SD302]